MIALLCFRRVNKKGVDGTQEKGLDNPRGRRSGSSLKSSN